MGRQVRIWLEKLLGSAQEGLATGGPLLYLLRMLSVKVSTKHQIVVPSQVREQLGIKAGDRLIVEVRDDEVVLRRRPEKASERLRGLGKGLYGDPVEYIRRLRDEWEERQRERDELIGR